MTAACSRRSCPSRSRDLTGNGCHFHVSIWRDGENLFYRDPAQTLMASASLELAYRFIAGLKAHAKAYIAITAPTVNSYNGWWSARRPVARPGRRLHQLRIQQPYADAGIPAPGRIEDRTVDGSCNPYLAAVAMLAAGLDGIETASTRPSPADQPVQAERGRAGGSRHRTAPRQSSGCSA